MYTSRLPVSTSVRRPTRDADSSRSDMLNRPSNIPVTVRKANLFTPQTKRPFSMGTSTAGKSYIGSMTTEKKYQRPLKPVPDRDLQMKMFDTLVEYIQTNAPNLPVPEAKKFFSSVSTTESTRIFEFLISRILPDFKISRLETDVPEALSTIEYPYIRSVTKSALVSVTTRQAAVGLLVIFYWLIGTIKQSENVVNAENTDEPDPRYELLGNILRYSEQDREAANARLLDDLDPLEDFDTLNKRYEDVTAEIEDIKAHLLECEDAAQEGQTIEEDTAKCRDYILEMRKYFDFKKNEEDDLKREILKLDILIEERLARNEKLKKEVKNHDMNLDDVRRIQATFDGMEKTDLSLEEQINRALNEKKKKETAINDRLNKLKAVISDKQAHLETLLERDIEVERLHMQEDLVKVEAQTAEINNDIARQREQFERINANLIEDENMELQRLHQEEAAVKEIAELNMKHLESVLDRSTRKALNLTKSIEEDVKQWTEALKRAEENARLLRTYSVMPKKSHQVSL